MRENSKAKSRQSNVMALCVLDSNLTACKIPHLIVSGKDGYDLLVQRHGRDEDYAKVAVLVAAAPAPHADLTVLVESVLSLDRDANLAAFWTITEALGWGKPVPVERGKAPEGKIRDVNLLVMRHCEWRQAPDLPEHIIKSVYDPTIRYFARVMLRSGARDVLERCGEDFESLVALGRIIAHNFHHKYRNVRASKEVNANYFAAHLKQRYANAVSQWRKHQQNVLPDEQTLAVTFGDEDASVQPHEQDEDHSRLVEMTAKEQRSLSPRLKKIRLKLVEERDERDAIRAAQPSLKDRLESMDHEERIAVLTTAADQDSRFIDPEAKRLAQKLLERERAQCITVACCVAEPVEALSKTP